MVDKLNPSFDLTDEVAVKRLLNELIDQVLLNSQNTENAKQSAISQTGFGQLTISGSFVQSEIEAIVAELQNISTVINTIRTTLQNANIIEVGN